MCNRIVDLIIKVNHIRSSPLYIEYLLILLSLRIPPIKQPLYLLLVDLIHAYDGQPSIIEARKDTLGLLI